MLSNKVEKNDEFCKKKDEIKHDQHDKILCLKRQSPHQNFCEG